MVMTENEIVRDYRASKNKGVQLTVLADRNVCSKNEIIEILIKNGVPDSELPKKDTRGRKPQGESSDFSIKLTMDKLAVESDKLEKEIADLERIIEKKREVYNGVLKAYGALKELDNLMKEGMVNDGY